MITYLDPAHFAAGIMAILLGYAIISIYITLRRGR